MTENKTKKQIFNAFVDETRIFEFKTKIEGSEILLKITELTTGEDNKITKAAWITKGRGRKSTSELDVGILRNEKILASISKPGAGLWVDGELVNINRENVERLKGKIADWINEKILELNELEEEERRDLRTG